MKPVLSALTFVCAFLAFSPAHADEAIATDRPDFVESSDVVGKGRVQIETSLAWERDRQAGLRSWERSTPSLLRIGIADTWELRFESDGALRSRETDGLTTDRSRGWSDLSVGLKWHQQDGNEEAGTPGMGWLFHVDGNTGSRAYRGQGLRPSLRFVAEWDLPQGFSLGLMPGIYLDRNDEGKRFTGGILAVVLGKSLAEKLRGFVEVSGQQLASKGNGGNVITFDTGMAYLLSNDMQVDVALSRGLTKTTPDLSWTVGFSIRF